MTALGRDDLSQTTIIGKANHRAQRRFHVAVKAGVVTVGEARETRLWIEAERLLDRLEWEARKRRRDEAQMRDIELGFGLPCCGADPLHWVGCPDWAPAMTEAEMRDWAPGEFTESWGK